MSSRKSREEFGWCCLDTLGVEEEGGATGLREPDELEFDGGVGHECVDDLGDYEREGEHRQHGEKQ